MVTQLDQMQGTTPAPIHPTSPLSSQVPNPVALLSALLADPEFERGLREGQEVFLEHSEPEPLTENKMIQEVEEELSRPVVEWERKSCRALGWEPTPYLYRLGFVIGTIAKGLTYAK